MGHDLGVKADVARPLAITLPIGALSAKAVDLQLLCFGKRIPQLIASCF